MEMEFDYFIHRGFITFGISVILIILIIFCFSAALITYASLAGAYTKEELSSLRNLSLTYLQSKQKMEKELENKMDWDPIDGSDSTNKILDSRVLLACIAAISLSLKLCLFLIHQSALTPYSGVINHELPVTLESSPTLGNYAMNGKNKGVVFIVNIIDFPDPAKRRDGAEVSKQLLLDLYSQRGFTPFYYESLTKARFLNLVDQLTTSKHLNSANCLFFVLLSHGAQ